MARFSSRDWRQCGEPGADGVWPWAKMQAEWAREPRIFFRCRKPEFSRLLEVLGGTRSPMIRTLSGESNNEI
jgi:hypothetical protein